MNNFLNKLIQPTILLALLAGLVGGYVAGYLPKSSDKIISDFYESETTVLVSPHGLRTHIDDGTFVLVDVRSQEEYETAHIIGAINIPAYATPDKSDYGAVDRIVSSFAQIVAENPDKDIVVYCYSAACMTGRKIGKMLSEHGIYVKELGIGWQEWRYYWDLWNHDGETKVSPENYIYSGKDPGVFIREDDDEGACPVGGSLSC